MTHELQASRPVSPNPSRDGFGVDGSAGDRGRRAKQSIARRKLGIFPQK